MHTIRTNPASTTPARPDCFRTRKEAQSAAILSLGQNAREEFEFETFRCDGRWLWRSTDIDDTKPMTEFERKCNGGARGGLALAASRARTEDLTTAAGRSRYREIADEFVDRNIGRNVRALIDLIAAQDREIERLKLDAMLVQQRPEPVVAPVKSVRLSVEDREKVALAVIRDGLPKAEAALRFKTTAKTVAKWVKRFEEEGSAGMLTRRRPAADNQRLLSIPARFNASAMAALASSMREDSTVTNIVPLVFPARVAAGAATCGSP